MATCKPWVATCQACLRVLSLALTRGLSRPPCPQGLSGLSASLDSLAVQLGVDRIAGHLSLAAHEVALACISVIPAELAELFLEDDEKYEGEDDGAGSSEEEGRPARAAAPGGGLAKKRGGGKAPGSRVHFEDDSPRAHHGLLDRPSPTSCKGSREPSRELSRELSREPSLLNEAISSLSSLSFLRSKKE